MLNLININVPIPGSSTYDDLCFVPLENTICYRCVNKLEALGCLLSTNSNLIGPDDLDPLFLNALSPRQLVVANCHFSIPV